jgi:delta8-fatty-acid desaturase
MDRERADELTVPRLFRLGTCSGNHPGGALAVLHYVGRDATDEIEAYHPVFALAKMKHYVFARVDSRDWQDESVVNGVGWKPLVPPLHLGWPGNASAYESVPSVDSTLGLMKIYDNSEYPTCGSPPGTTLPFLAKETLEPAPPPPEICPIEQQRLSIAFRKLRWEMLQEPGLFELNWWELYKWHILRTSILFASFVGFYAYATSKCALSVVPSSSSFSRRVD